MLGLKRAENTEYPAQNLLLESDHVGIERLFAYHQATYELVDYYDKETKTTSIAHTTGYPCAIVIRLVDRGEYRNPELNLPEYLGRDPKIYEKIMKKLKRRNIILKEKIEAL